MIDILKIHKKKSLKRLNIKCKVGRLEISDVTANLRKLSSIQLTCSKCLYYVTSAVKSTLTAIQVATCFDNPLIVDL